MDPEKIAKISLDFYKSLSKTGKPSENNEWTVLATILQEHNDRLDVIALGTGTKCIGRAQMTAGGTKINDSHAEVVCRRAFLRYIYNEMIGAEASPILERNLTGKYTLAAGLKFHMYSTLMPCGDASIFPKVKDDHDDYGLIVDNPIDDDLLAHKRRKVDVHRTGAKCLPSDDKIDAKVSGIGFHTLGAVRTKPGRGDPTLSVSCSDKFAKWIHLGVQGALLSLLLDKPIYLSSITIGNNVYQRKAFERALYQRFDTENDAHVEKYKLHLPDLLTSTMHEFPAQKMHGKQPCPSSIVYTKNQQVEVIVEGMKQGVTKKNLASPSGRLKICKLELFQSFKEVVDKVGLDFDTRKSYGSLKNSSVYAKCWSALKKGKFHVWPEKDAFLQEFFI